MAPRRLLACALLALAACATRVEPLGDEYAGVEGHRARCDSGRFWLYAVAERKGDLGGFVWSLELRIQSRLPHDFSKVAMRGGRRLPVERLSDEAIQRRAVPFSTRSLSVFVELYRIGLDEAALGEVLRDGLDAMAYGPNRPGADGDGRLQLTCEAEVFRAISERVGGPA